MKPALVESELGYHHHVAERARLRRELRLAKDRRTNDRHWDLRVIWAELLHYSTPMHKIRVHLPSGPWEVRASPQTIEDWKADGWRIQILAKDRSREARRPHEFSWEFEP